MSNKDTKSVITKMRLDASTAPASISKSLVNSITNELNNATKVQATITPLQIKISGGVSQYSIKIQHTLPPNSSEQDITNCENVYRSILSKIGNKAGVLQILSQGGID